MAQSGADRFKKWIEGRELETGKHGIMVQIKRLQWSKERGEPSFRALRDGCPVVLVDEHTGDESTRRRLPDNLTTVFFRFMEPTLASVSLRTT